MPYADEDLVPISALQHHLFCPRQCALIHIDGLWAENRLTAEGKVLHENSDTPGQRTHHAPPTVGSIPQPATEPDSTSVARPVGGVRLVRALPLLCRRLGLVGQADQVEFTLGPDGAPIGSPRPVEHKRGKPKRLDHDRVQVAAQGLCLEEMFGLPVTEGELFYHAVRRRERVVLDQALRSLVETITGEVRATIEANRVPLAAKQPKCRSCSLLHLCMPGGVGPQRSASRYLSRALSASTNRQSIHDSQHDEESDA